MKFDDLKKIPNEPAARLLAGANIKLSTKLEVPVSTGVEKYLELLHAKGELIDILMLLSVSLPSREAVWWACLAGADLHEGNDEATPCLAAAKSWVFKPNDENREAARLAVEGSDIDDNTKFCAIAAYYGDGTAGVGEMSEYPAPPPAVAGNVLAQNMLALEDTGMEFENTVRFLIGRALDIARGGNGRIERVSSANAEEDA